MPDYDPSALNEAKARFEEHLHSSQAGAEVLEILTSRHVGVSMLPKCFTYAFSEEQRQDFGRLLRPPWIDSLKRCSLRHLNLTPACDLEILELESSVKPPSDILTPEL